MFFYIHQLFYVELVVGLCRLSSNLKSCIFMDDLESLPLNVPESSSTVSTADSDVEILTSDSESPPLPGSPVYSIPQVFPINKDHGYKKAAETILEHTQKEILSNKISAPYEVPQFPIEVHETRSKIQKQISIRTQEDKKEKYIQDENISVPVTPEEISKYCHVDDDFVYKFQRVSISGEETSGVPLEDLQQASYLLIQAVRLRERYMAFSNQSFPVLTSRFLRLADGLLLEGSQDQQTHKSEGVWGWMTAIGSGHLVRTDGNLTATQYSTLIFWKILSCLHSRCCLEKIWCVLCRTNLQFIWHA